MKYNFNTLEEERDFLNKLTHEERNNYIKDVEEKTEEYKKILIKRYKELKEKNPGKKYGWYTKNISQEMKEEYDLPLTSSWLKGFYRNNLNKKNGFE